jgi:transcription elongation factor GreA
MPKSGFFLTQDGIKNFEKELQYLKTVGRKEIAEKIKIARAQGDLSENAEYDAAKEEQGHMEFRITELENILHNAEVIDTNISNKEEVTVGSKVKLENLDSNDISVYLIVGSTEVDPASGKISNESPLGAALLGRAIGDEVNVSAPIGVVKYKIIEIL